MPDSSTLEEQIEAVQWAEAQAIFLARQAALGHLTISLIEGKRGLTRKQIDLYRSRLTAAVETLQQLAFMRETMS